MSCLKCFKILIPDIPKIILITRLRLLDAGFLLEAQNIFSFLAESSLTSDDLGNHSNSVEVLETLEKYVKKLNSNNVTKTSRYKSIEVLKNRYIHETVSAVVKEKQCPKCKQPWKRVTVIQKKLMQVASVEPAKKFKENSSGSSKLPTIKEGGYTYVLPSQACLLYTSRCV